jgi:hypothetical protein
MADNLAELIARVAVLCLGVTDGNSFCRLSHSSDVECESVWVGLRESPYLISNGCYAALLGRTITFGTCRQNQETEHRQYYGRQPGLYSYEVFHFMSVFSLLGTKLFVFFQFLTEIPQNFIFLVEA